MSSEIHFSVRGEGPPVIVMHGLFGAGNNLGALARSLSDRYCVYSLDLPNHGRSAWIPQMSPAVMAQKIHRWLQIQGLDQVTLVGHSLGGKVAMELALSEPKLVNALVVADIAPVEYPAHHQTVLAALSAVQQAECVDRQAAKAILLEHLDEPELAGFFMTSLQKGEAGCCQWRFNLDVIIDDYNSIRQAPTGGRRYPKPVLFVKGGDSDYILPQHREQVLGFFPEAQIKVMPDCGHWLHAQKPELFNGIVGRFLDDNVLAMASTAKGQ